MFITTVIASIIALCMATAISMLIAFPWLLPKVVSYVPLMALTLVFIFLLARPYYDIVQMIIRPWTCHCFSVFD